MNDLKGKMKNSNICKQTPEVNRGKRGLVQGMIKSSRSKSAFTSDFQLLKLGGSKHLLF